MILTFTCTPLNVHENVNSTTCFSSRNNTQILCTEEGLHNEKLLLKSLITYTFIVWSKNSKNYFFFLSEEKETLISCLLKNTDFHKTYDYCLFPLWFCRLKSSSRVPVLYIKPNRENAFLCQSDWREFYFIQRSTLILPTTVSRWIKNTFFFLLNER